MRGKKLELYLHLVWATWDRLPLISTNIERRLYRNIESEAIKQRCNVLAVGGIEDHIHLLVTLPSTLAVANLVKQVKGVSSHFVNETLKPSSQFKWQGGYGAFTLSRWDVDQIAAYVLKQKEHHASSKVLPEFEETLIDNEILPSA
jgi:REP element-mobilizing transposase RayT